MWAELQCNYMFTKKNVIAISLLCMSWRLGASGVTLGLNPGHLALRISHLTLKL